jgi:hemolysin III
MTYDICPVSGETFKEELLNHWTHFIGLLLSIIGFPVLIVYSSLNGDAWHIASYATYGATLVLLYFASTYYHGCKTIHRKKYLQIADHACIYLLIAGSYTPFTLGPLRETSGWTLLSVEWGMALVGIIFKLFGAERFRIFSLVTYLLMGWLVVVSWSTLMETLSLSTLVLVGIGGLSYTFGAIFFIWESLPFNHAIWHLFVLSGSGCHYCAMLSLF